MARKSRDERLDTRTARLRLAPRREPYWRNIQEGRAIGYRRAAGGKAGTWIARHYDPTAATARQYQSLGVADDFMDADGATTLTFTQAQDKARAWFADLARAGGKVSAPITVREAVKEYEADYTARGGKALAAMKAGIDAHILPKLGERKVADLTAAVIRAWHRGLATAPARLRTGAKATAPKVREIAADDADAHRARRSTANRLLTTLKAALNLAYREGKVPADDAWRRVQPFQKVDTAKVRYLTDDETTRLVNACGADLRAIVTAALLTGCRYGELTTLRPGDVDLDANMLTIRASKGGAARHIVLTDEAAEFFKQQCHGKKVADLLLKREDGDAWGKSEQFRRLRAACAAAKISPAVSFHILRHTHASRLAMRGVPMAVIASQLGHADLKMTTQHYAHLSPGYVSDTIRAAFGSLGIVPASNVAAFRPTAAA
jgi:integrase